MVSKRTPEEQALYDELAKAFAIECFRRTGKVEGCAHAGRDAADAFIAERRDSIAADKQ